MGFVELAPPGEVMISSPDQKSFHAYNSNKPETKTVVFRVDTAPHGAETPTPLADADWLGFVKPPAIGEYTCLLYTSPSPRDGLLSRMPSSA